jgi:hypothetical protein
MTRLVPRLDRSLNVSSTSAGPRVGCVDRPRAPDTMVHSRALENGGVRD